ncbi:hypothetical protein AB1N83_006176 [Pleurotus pulmonarius]
MFNNFVIVACLTIATSYLNVLARPASLASGASMIARDDDVATSALANFPGCSLSQTTTLKSAILVAQDFQAKSWEYFRRLGPNSPAANTDLKRYTMWFGAFTPARYTTCADNTDATCGGVLQRLENNTYSNSAGLNQHTRIATITLCKGSFLPLVRDNDDNGQTIIHEASHFHYNGVAGTNHGQVETDYGATGCLNLAKNHPDQAVDNADNYGYFAQYPDGCGRCHIQ